MVVYFGWMVQLGMAVPFSPRAPETLNPKPILPEGGPFFTFP